MNSRRRLLSRKSYTYKDYAQNGLIFQVDGIADNKTRQSFTDLISGLTPTYVAGTGYWNNNSYHFTRRKMCYYNENIGNSVSDNNFTIELCFSNKESSNGRMIGLNGYNNTNTNRANISMANSRFRCQRIQSNSVWADFNSASNNISFDDRENHTAVMVVTSDQFRVYLDNNLKTALSAVWTNAKQGITIGDYSFGSLMSSSDFKSNFDCFAVRMYNRALTDKEIAKNYKIDISRFKNGGGG